MFFVSKGHNPNKKNLWVKTITSSFKKIKKKEMIQHRDK